MNWIEGKTAWGSVSGYEPLRLKRERFFTDKEELCERYTFTNETNFDVYMQAGTIRIATPFNDNYQDAPTCMEERCHTHLWPFGRSSSVMALRMGGRAPHLGLVLNEGSLRSYSVEREEEEMSNDRGDFFLHPDSFVLLPGESYTLAWTLFWHEGAEDFTNKALQHPGYVMVEADSFNLFAGEDLVLRMKYNCPEIEPVKEELKLFENGVSIPFELRTMQGDENIREIFIKRVGLQPGVYAYELKSVHYAAEAMVKVMPSLKDLGEARCHFIAKKQQNLNRASHLHGAYLIYDNETEEQFYSHLHDHNGGRERVSMGVLLTLWSRQRGESSLDESQEAYAEYLLRELFDEHTGTVYNDVKRNNDWHRLYNYPWVSLYFLERYRKNKQIIDLQRMLKCLYAYYESGGANFYAIEIPVFESVELLKDLGMTEDADKLTALFCKHADNIAALGTNYPAHEVKYEQSIVAPAASTLLDAYRVCGNPKYLEAGIQQIHILELFNGNQAHYLMNETAIRHWDGFWFGKRKLYGDTYPHYWSSLSGNAFWRYYLISGDEKYAKKAEASWRSALNLFFPDGRASAAMLFPETVNSRPGHYFDPWANDQDWAMYFALKYIPQ